MEITVICSDMWHLLGACIFILVYYSKFLRAGIGNSGDLRRGTRGSFVVLASVAAALLWCSQFFFKSMCHALPALPLMSMALP